MILFVAYLLLGFLNSLGLISPKPNSADRLALANNKFAFELQKTFSSEGNTFSSPVSVFTALGMLYIGARGVTAEEIRHALSYNTAGLREESINHHFQKLLNSFAYASDEGRLGIANALVSQNKYPIFKEYKEALKNYYSAIVKEVDFNTEPEKAVHEINSWVSNKTQGKIPRLLESLDPDTILVLLNAIYFKGTWKNKFNRKITKEGKFYNDGINAVTVPVMNQENQFFYGKFPEHGVQALKMPYVNDKVSMVILLPLQKTGLRTVERRLTSNILDNIITRLKEDNVSIKLPKFKLEDSRKLKHNLQSLGMELAFTNMANFGGITKKPYLKVSKIIHKAMVEVTEAGTEAGGGTAVVINRVMRTNRIDFIVEHPFLFFIRDNLSGMILFSGRVNLL